ncbi:MAG: rhomboid family intramembrane serine protease [Treponema sp.]|nr:rhomboid family intramembrane serine protease [Treponema sp.]MBR4630701.1 rhomboid family intramembrane serine protease [Treponema sp.]MBR6913450.1 rhomboid family intramembrane serine protease [Treponema sp.]
MINSGKKASVSFNSPVILIFTLLCFAVLILGIITKDITTVSFFSVYRSPLFNPLTYLRMFTHVLGHAGWEHFFSNITMILVIGPLLEEKYGSENILFVILATALATGIVHFIFFPGIRLLGASGVVFAFILLSSFTSTEEGKIPATFILVAVIYLGQQIFSALFVNDNISNLGHILGGIVGSVLGFIMNKNKMYGKQK